MSLFTSWPRSRVLLALMCSAWAAPASSQPEQRSVDVARQAVIADPDIRSGVLANGMRFLIKRNAIPRGSFSVRLGMDVGSFEEQESERGFAHFVEHMAFRTTRSAPEGDLERRLTRFGVAFGRDQNAQTTPFTTTYRLDYGSVDEEGAGEGFGWLRDVADGIVFAEAGVSVERGVVVAEQDARNGPETLTAEAVARFQGPGLRTLDRLPGGKRETVTAARADTLRAFYDRWYRPENATLVVVGDMPVDKIEAMIRTGFASWQGKGARPLRSALGKVDPNRGLDAISIAAPSLPTFASACRARPPAPLNETEIARQVREVRSAIWHEILNARLSSLVNAGSSGLLGAGVDGVDERERATTCLIVLPAGESWEKGLESAQAELRRFLADGPTEGEVETQIAQARAKLRAGINGAQARDTRVLADEILQRALDRRPVMAPREAMHAFNVAVEDVDAAAIKAVAGSDWSGAGPLIALIRPTGVDASQLRGAWLRNDRATALAAFTDRKAVEWAYTDFGKPGIVASREEIADPGFVRLRFANGLVLNFKQSGIAANAVELRARFGAGRREIPNSGYVAALLGSNLLKAGGLGRLSAEELERSLLETSWDFGVQIGNDHFQLASSTNKANLTIQLQVFAAFLSDPGFRTAIDERIPGAVDIMYRMVGSQPQLALGEALMAGVDPNNPTRIPPPPQMAGLNSSGFQRLLKPPLTTAPIELTLVGDVDEATATRLVAQTLGALPPRKDGDRTRSDTHFLRFPDRTWPVIRTTHSGAADRAAALLVWPTFVAEPARRREEYALNLAAAIFNDRLRQRVRNELGKTYDPQVSTAMPDNADQGYLAAQLESNPAELDLLIAEAKSVGRTIAAGALSVEALDAVRKPMLSSAAARRGQNIWWAGALSGSARTSAVTEEVTKYETLLSSVTLDEVKAAAARWLTAAPIVTVATPAGTASTNGPAPVAEGAWK